MNPPVQSGARTLRRILLLAASLVVGAVGWFLLGEPEAVAEESSDDQVLSESSSTGKVLARVHGVAITEAEVLEDATAEILKLERQRHETVTNFVKAKIRDRLLDAEAEKRSLSRDDLLELEVKAKIADVPDGKVSEFYEARKARIRQPLPQVEGQIREVLAFEALVDRLWEAGEVDLLIEPFRIDVAAKGPAKGSAQAPVTIVEFSDFQCPYCSRVNPALKEVEEKYGSQIRVVFRQFPLTSIHPQAKKAGEASLCANEQNTDFFWQMHDAMFADQAKLGVDGLRAKAAAIKGLDADAFNQCLDSSRYESQVDEDMKDGAAVGVTGTPAFFINGRFLSGAQSLESFVEIIDDELERAKG